MLEGTNCAPLPIGVFHTEVEEKGCKKRSRQGKDARRSSGRSKKSTMEEQEQCIGWRGVLGLQRDKKADKGDELVIRCH